MSRVKPERNAEEILGSKGRIRVLKVLSESGELVLRDRTNVGGSHRTVEPFLRRTDLSSFRNTRTYADDRTDRVIRIEVNEEVGIHPGTRRHPHLDSECSVCELVRGEIVRRAPNNEECCRKK